MKSSAAVVEQPTLTEAAEASRLPVTRQTGALMFERFATDPNVDVEKLERLMTLWERGEARAAESAFNAAMSDAQAETRSVAADANNPQTRSRYASYKALDDALRPIYTRHRFALSFNSGEAPGADVVRVLCDVTHAGGHSKSYKLDMPADGKGAKGGDVMTKTHAVGAAMSYGMRYMLKMIFNVAVGEDDDDGNGATAKRQPQSTAPAGFDDWLVDMEAVADEGSGKLQAAWNKSKPEYRAYMVGPHKAVWTRLKAKAATVQA